MSPYYLKVQTLTITKKVECVATHPTSSPAFGYYNLSFRRKSSVSGDGVFFCAMRIRRWNLKQCPFVFDVT